MEKLQNISLENCQILKKVSLKVLEDQIDYSITDIKPVEAPPRTGPEIISSSGETLSSYLTVLDLPGGDQTKKTGSPIRKKEKTDSVTFGFNQSDSRVSSTNQLDKSPYATSGTNPAFQFDGGSTDIDMPFNMIKSRMLAKNGSEEMIHEEIPIGTNLIRWQSSGISKVLREELIKDFENEQQKFDSDKSLKLNLEIQESFINPKCITQETKNEEKKQEELRVLTEEDQSVEYSESEDDPTAPSFFKIKKRHDRPKFTPCFVQPLLPFNRNPAELTNAERMSLLSCWCNSFTKSLSKRKSNWTRGSTCELPSPVDLQIPLRLSDESGKNEPAEPQSPISPGNSM